MVERQPEELGVIGSSPIGDTRLGEALVISSHVKPEPVLDGAIGTLLYILEA